MLWQDFHIDLSWLCKSGSRSTKPGRSLLLQQDKGSSNFKQRPLDSAVPSEPLNSSWRMCSVARISFRLSCMDNKSGACYIFLVRNGYFCRRSEISPRMPIWNWIQRNMSCFKKRSFSLGHLIIRERISTDKVKAYRTVWLFSTIDLFSILLYLLHQQS